MHIYDATTYGDRFSDIYDQWYRDYDPAAIDALAELARGGPALELGIGTGRFALPLQEKGVIVHGVDASEKMVARMRTKPGGERIPVAIGNFADVPVEGQYPLIYIVFNTIFALLSQDEQVRCFQNVAAHLTPDGVFVTETFVPDMTRFRNHRRIDLIDLDDGYVRVDAARHDPLRQWIFSNQVVWSESGMRFYPVKLRYIWPSELDLMARLAGLRLAERWGDWDKRPFTAESKKHISLYRPLT
ncbi:MAG: class I SAM-dependent methyltransferase [Chloroflexi bacterium]|nr:class I SAM-dependent methyltransferase [Chloroflexota bacterium]